MELIQLKYFLAIVEEETMLRAADTLHVSQSTLSMAMKRLEAELGFALFQRVGRRLYPTEDGLRFYSGTARILRELEDLTRQCRTQAQRADAAVAVEAVDFSVEALTRYSGLWPDRAVRQVRSTRNMTHQLLRSGQVDFCITSVDDTEAGFQVERILSEPMELLVSRAHPLAAQESVSLDELQDETFIVIKPEYAHRLSIERMCEENGFQMRRIYELHDEEALTVMVSKGVGVTFIPESIINMHGPTTVTLSVPNCGPEDNGHGADAARLSYCPAKQTARRTGPPPAGLSAPLCRRCGPGPRHAHSGGDKGAFSNRRRLPRQSVRQPVIFVCSTIFASAPACLSSAPRRIGAALLLPDAVRVSPPVLHPRRREPRCRGRYGCQW
ncbi:MAG: LysR family transcriptional regulator [Oscillospiraceae bacterium]|nr:LysR family transcriptional regulator [Oscillospiraceae bacterium]